MKLFVTPLLCALLLAYGGIDEALNCLGQEEISMPAAFAQEAKKEMPACLAEIAKASAIEDCSMHSAKLKDSLMAAQKLGSGCKDFLVEIIQTGTPAGRILSLALLKKSTRPSFKIWPTSLSRSRETNPLLMSLPLSVVTIAFRTY